MSIASEAALAAAAPRGWPRRYTVIALCVAASFVCYIDRVNISVAAITMQEQFGWSEQTKGLVLSSFFLGYMLFQVPSGWLANRIGGKFVLGFAVVWWSLFTMLTPIAAAMSLPVLLGTRVAMGLGEAAMYPSAYNLFARWVPTSERSRALSLLVSGIPLGTLIGLMSTGWIIKQWGWQSVFFIFGAVGVVWCVVWFLRAHNRPDQDPHMGVAELSLLTAHAADADVPKESVEVPWAFLLKHPAVWALITNHFCSNWVLYMLLAWLPSYFHGALHFDLVKAGLLSAAPWLSMFVFGNLGGMVADRMITGGMDLTRVRKIMQLSGLLGAAACMLSVQNVSTPMPAVALMCGALGFISLTWSGFMPNHLEIAPRYADVLMGITNTAGTIPGIVGVYVTGALVTHTGGYGSAFMLCAAVEVLGAVVWLIWGTARRIVD
jgi:ACS family sodium-dependent inorganic phosphate cotransporter